MYTIKIQTWNKGEEYGGFSTNLYIEGQQITHQRYQRKETGKESGDEIKPQDYADFFKDIDNALMLGEVYYYNHNDNADTAMSFAYFDTGGLYRAIVVFGPCRVYLMSSSGKTIDSFVI